MRIVSALALLATPFVPVDAVIGRPVPVAVAVPSAPAEGAAEQSARQWIALIDAQKWQDSWAATSDLFRAQVTADQWAKLMETMRVPLGAARSRNLATMSPMPAPPNAPAGIYQIVQFKTGFDQRSDVVETIVLYQQGDKWMVVGYFIR